MINFFVKLKIYKPTNDYIIVYTILDRSQTE